MKVARELRNQGLTGLDLIPLYPTSFVPPTLIQSITIERVQGQKHITFAVENLNSNTDRVLSLMFAIYNESDVFLGYKLYLGYYYASNPGFLEVDVDSVAEINTHCFVRAITNDDVNSSVDMIASPNLEVGGVSKETRDFNTAIREVQKLPAGIKVIFEEMWKESPSFNEITITANFVSNGKTATATATRVNLANENGYCSVLIPFATSDNQHLPAFPNSSNFVISSVTFEGSTWQYTKSNDTVPYSDTDLTRTINASPTWDSSSTGDIAFTIPFGGTVASGSQSMQMICSGRFDKRSAIAQNFNYVGDGSNLSFICSGEYKNYPMATSGDKITLPAMQFICNGVTYNLASQDVNLRNAIKTSYYMRSNDVGRYFYRDGGGSVGEALMSLTISIDNLKVDTEPTYDNNFISHVNTVDGFACNPNYCQMELDNTDPSESIINIIANFDGADLSGDINTSCAVVPNEPGNQFNYKGITYYFPIFPSTIGSWTV
ncbi:MAG TPA: hypothetical protein VFC76_05840 [Oscillospiraceae bacterium]|nr:hypothetical protein [Oscillospiraceae bacterium]